MKRQYRIALGVAVLFVLGAGGVLLAGPPLQTHGDTSYLAVSPVAESTTTGPTVAFSDLTTAQQSVFREALQSEDLVAIPDDVERQVWIEHDYVRYRNRTYHAAVAVN